MMIIIGMIITITGIITVTTTRTAMITTMFRPVSISPLGSGSC